MRAVVHAQASTWSWRGHPLWLVGFRPFFLLACVAGAALPLLWVAIYAGAMAPPPGLSALQWHAHEMFYGFGFAVLGGFLLTASKNWVKARGHFGRTLQVLVALWLLERVSVWWLGAGPHAFVFPVALAVAITWTLLRGRAQDSYRDNGLFILALSAFVVARGLLLSREHFEAGRELSLALFRLAFVVMLERTIPPFMRGAFQLEVRRVFALDTAVKVLAVALVPAVWLPSGLRVAVEVGFVVVFAARMLLWQPLRALARVEVGVMYVGALCLALQVALRALGGAWVGSAPLHIFSFGTMGLIIPAMLTRIAQGHTGRPIQFGVAERVALGLMSLAGLARVVGPQVAPSQYQSWLIVAAVGWAACFCITLLRIAPMLWAERVDGREH